MGTTFGCNPRRHGPSASKQNRTFLRPVEWNFEVCFYAAYGTTGVAAAMRLVRDALKSDTSRLRWKVWFAFINFLGDEVYHPLDFFSNKMRTRQTRRRFERTTASSQMFVTLWHFCDFVTGRTGTFWCLTFILKHRTFTNVSQRMQFNASLVVLFELKCLFDSCLFDILCKVFFPCESLPF